MAGAPIKAVDPSAERATDQPNHAAVASVSVAAGAELDDQSLSEETWKTKASPIRPSAL